MGDRAGILHLCERVFTGDTEDLTSIRAACSFIKGIEINLKCALMAFEDLGLIRLQGNSCQSAGLTYDKGHKDIFIAGLCSSCLEYLISEDLVDRGQIRYDEGADLFCIPRFAFKIGCSAYRNMLIALGAMEPRGAQFAVASAYEPQLSRAIGVRGKALTQEGLLRKLERERLIGEEGERFVLCYERGRCRFSQDQISRIKQVSLVDVAAGYDIISFEDESGDERRYIEVKTYLGKPHFNWSANEISSARLRRDSYCIYLVDYSRIRSPGYCPYIIRNPYSEVRDSTKWRMSPTSYLVEPAFGLGEPPEAH